MMTLSELWKHFHFLTDLESIPEDKRSFLQEFLQEEYSRREQKRIASLLRMSGIKRVKLLGDFDWTFNPKIPREKLMEFLQTDWLTKPANLVIIGPAGVGKSHIASALCHDAILKGHLTLFCSLFDLTTKMTKSKNVYTLIDYYGRVPILCLDELGYVMPTREQADAIFQIVSKRAELATTIITTNLVPSHWGKIFDTATASAILDRLSMNGRFITFEGRSYRSSH
jgi:DNA replication protein DnaC